MTKTQAKPELDYRAFLNRKSQLGGMSGFEPLWIPPSMFNFQESLTSWAIRKGRASIFADCGMGKSIMQLAWAENVVRKTNKPVLLVTPLAVCAQTIREGEKFGIECRRSSDGKAEKGITITNYERLEKFNPSDFVGTVCDESAVIKNMDGVRRGVVTEFVKKHPYRLLCTATPAPNDFVELGTSSEAVGDLGCMDMLLRFFKNDTKTLHIHGSKQGDFQRNQWRFKPHAEHDFWRWVCSWARACRKPSDLGFEDGKFRLPNLVTKEHRVKASIPSPDFLFEIPASSLREQREESRRSLPDRCEEVARIVDTEKPAICWCHLNDEADLLEKIVVGAVQISGSDEDEEKEEKFLDFIQGKFRVLVTKSKIAGFGLNLQHCAHMTFFPSYSYEQYYQSVRRCWRFGQTQDVNVDIVTTEGDSGVLKRLQKKSEQADRMFASLVRLMNNSMQIGIGSYGEKQERIPAWLSSTNN